MIDCQIVIGPANRKRAADNFMDQTTRFACVSNLTTAYLSFVLEEPSEFKIVVDDIDIHKEVLPEGSHERSLAHLLTSAKLQTTAERGVWMKHRQPIVGKSPVNASDYPRIFKAVFRRSDGSDQVVATFEFALLDDHSYARQFERYDASHRPAAAPVLPIASGCADSSTCCKKCGGFLPKGRSTCRNCGEPREMPTAAKWKF